MKEVPKRVGKVKSKNPTDSACSAGSSLTIGTDRKERGGLPQNTAKLDELKRLVGPESERVEKANPDLAESLRLYRKDWRAFREAVGDGSGKTSAAPARGRRYRA
jgi:hypothetical protein